MKILSERDPLEVFSEASKILNNAVEHTLGPDGTNTAVHFQNFYNIINDGKSIIEQLTSLDPEIAPAMETLKQSAFETNRKAGDGTTSTIIIMNQLIQGAKKYLEENPKKSQVQVAKRILDVEKRLQDLILKQKIEIDNKLYEKVAKVSLGSSSYSQMLSEAFTFLNGDGVPALVKSDIPGVELEKIDGVNLTKTSVVSSMFIDLLPSKELKDVQVITLFQVIDRFEEMFQLVKLLNQNKEKYTVLLYNEISSSALENLLFNLSQDKSKIVPICMKDYGKDMNNMLDEIAKYTETEIIDGGSLKTTDISKINQAVILGSGGASQSVAYVLKILNIPYLIVSRTKKDFNKNIHIITYEDLNSMDYRDFSLIVNATPCGMYGKNENSIPNIDMEKINDKHIVFDLIYNPSPTLLLSLASKKGAKTIDGLQMLYSQAEYSWQIWNS